MPTEVKVPSMGESITSGILAAWHVADGDYVEKDQVLYELETDKITSEAMAESAGVIPLKAGEGAEVEIGQVVAEIDESAEKPDGAGTETPKEEPKAEKTPEAKAEPAPALAPKGDMPVSPAVRRIAAESGVDPASVAPGSGKGGRVTKGDMLEAVEKGGAKPAPVPTQAV